MGQEEKKKSAKGQNQALRLAAKLQDEQQDE
jgi:hypothetical protein